MTQLRSFTLGLIVLGLLIAPAFPATQLKVGDTAPDFTLPSTHGGDVTLSEFRGKQNVVLAFYPAAFTGGCTKEMQAYQLNLGKFEGAETQVFGLSTDNVPSQRKFAEDLGVKFPMLSDFLNRGGRQRSTNFSRYCNTRRYRASSQESGPLRPVENRLPPACISHHVASLILAMSHAPTGVIRNN